MKNLSFLLIVFMLAGIQAPGNAQIPEMPGQLIDMGGYNLHFNVMGSGDKTIVIETGTGSWSLHWLRFQERLAKDFSSNYWEAYQISIARASYYEAMYNELDLLPLTYEQVKVEDPFQKPALIVTAGSSFSAFTQVRNLPIDESNEIWMKLQKELLLVSTYSQQKILDGASHDLLLSGFDGLKTAVESFVKGL